MSTPLAGTAAFRQSYERKLELLRHLIATPQGALVPELHPLAPQGHAIPFADRVLGVGEGESFGLLEELSDAGLLRREPHNVIHVCPECHRSQISFRELCTLCSSFDLELESLVNHFRCSYTGVESSFTSGFDLVCPKCHRVLNQLGQDFDRPGKVYVCRACRRVSEEPVVRVQCLHCAKEFESKEVEPIRIHRYLPTLLAARAVELKRLTCLDLSSVMFDSRVGLATREFLNLQARRELARLERHGTPFATAVLCFRQNGVTYPVFREWHAQDLRQLGRAIVESLRSLDLVSQLDSSRLGLLFPDTDARGAAAVRERLTSRLGEYVLKSHSSQLLHVAWTDDVWAHAGHGPDEVMAFFDRDPEEELTHPAARTEARPPEEPREQRTPGAAAAAAAAATAASDATVAATVAATAGATAGAAVGAPERSVAAPPRAGADVGPEPIVQEKVFRSLVGQLNDLLTTLKSGGGGEDRSRDVP